MRPALFAKSFLAVAAAASVLVACHESGDASSSVADAAPSWQLLASELPSALLSVAGRSRADVFAVGADKGDGPWVLHFDGKKWTREATGSHGDLWWVTVPASGPVLMGGANATVLRYDGTRFERLRTPGIAHDTVYGVWGKSGDDFYAVGSEAGRNGFVWHYHGGAFENERLPMDLPLTSAKEVPGFFKVWGSGDDVWVVGSAGAVMHRTKDGPFTVMPSGAKDTLFTASGAGDRVLAVGGSGNGVLLEERAGSFKNVSPQGAGLLQGVFATESHGDWVSGERGAIWSRKSPEGAFAPVDHGLVIPASSSLHSIFVDDTGGVWAAGGNVLTPALDGGMLVHYGAPVPIVTLDDEPAMAKADAGAAVTCPADVLAAGKNGSIARRWDEQILAAIRLDLPRPTVHARNLFHMSAAMWDAWAAYDPKVVGYFVNEKHTDADVAKARRLAISYAAYDVLVHRYEHAIGGARSVACFRALMKDLGYDANDAHDQGDDPVALGNRIGHTIVRFGASDGANEQADYADPKPPKLVNPPLVYDQPGTTLVDPAVWQPINLSVASTQNGIILPAGVQTYIGSNWDDVKPFALRRKDASVPYEDPGPVPSPKSPDMKQWLVEVIRKTAQMDPSGKDTIDISPGAYGHNSLGANDGKGWAKNPVTGQPYPPQVVPLSDFARVMAEFWADGPKSETPPGHWNTLANAVADSPAVERKLYGTGAPLDPLAWDVHVYFAINGALHDAAIAAWGLKRRDMTVRAISLIRWMGAKGQSSDPKLPSYDPEGLPLVPGLIELVTKESSAPGQRHEELAYYVGQVAVKCWRGEPGDRTHEISGVGWMRAIDWITYQRRTFVTPAFPGFISGHSTFSRAAADTLASLTGSPYFPGGYAEWVAPKDAYLQFEKGPSVDVHLGWAAYTDASDEAGQSRIWGSIHIPPDDFAGRRVGHRVGLRASALAKTYFDGTAPPPPAMK